MRVTLGIGGATLHREPGDKRIGKESTVVFHMRNLLNAQGYHFVRIDPRRYGLTDCRLGLADHKRGIMLWHERYAIENAATEFNAINPGQRNGLGWVGFERVDDKVSHRRLSDKALIRSGVSRAALEVLAPFETKGKDWKLRLEMLQAPRD